MNCDDNPNVCMHGVPERVSCCGCKQKELNEKMDWLQNHIAGVVNEVVMKVNNLEKSREAHSRSNKDIFERIEKLESNHTNQLSPLAYLNLKEKIEKLEQLFYDEKEKFRNQDKKPHKCPVCDGTKFVYAIDIMKNIECNACKGASIVWG